jgi:hypothetical protein
VREPRGALGGVLDLLDVRVDRRPARVLVGAREVADLLADERGVVEDDGEQVVEVVGDAAGELAEALQPLRLVQLALEALALGLRPQPLALGLRLHPLGDVAHGRGDQQPFLGVDR